MKNLYFFILALFLPLVSGFDVKEEVLTSHPSWENNKFFYNSNFDGLVIIGSIPSFGPKQWEVWGKNVSLLPYHRKVTSVLLNHGSISGEFAEYLCNFENIEFLTLGISVEGILLSEEAFKVFAKMKRLKHLHIAIHGIDDNYFKNITLFNSLESLVIQFPDKLMIIENELHLWSKTYLSDLSLYEIAKIESLRSLEVFSFNAEYVEVAFSFPTIERIINLPNIEKFHLATSNFSRTNGSFDFRRERTKEAKKE